MKVINAIVIDDGFIRSVCWREFNPETHEWSGADEVVDVAEVVKAVEQNARLGMLDVRTGGIWTRGLQLSVIEYGFGRKAIFQSKASNYDSSEPRLYSLPQMNVTRANDGGNVVIQADGKERLAMIEALSYVSNERGTDLIGFLADHEPNGARLWLELSIAGLVFLDEDSRIDVTEQGARELVRLGM